MLQNALNGERNCRLNRDQTWNQKNEKNRREDPKSARKSLRSTKNPKRKRERIHNIPERLWKRKARAFKERILHAYCFNLDLEIVQSFQEIFNQQSTSSQAFKRSSTLRKSEKGVLHLSKAFIVIFAHLRSCYCINLCSKFSNSLWVFVLIFGEFPKQGKVDPNLKSEYFGFACTRKTSVLAWDS